MVFYEINAGIQNCAELMSEGKEYGRRRANNTLFHMPTQKVFTLSKRQCCIFIYRFQESTASAVIGAFGSTRADVEKYLPRFLDCAGIQTGTLAWEETTISTMKDMLRRASREDFIEDDDMYLDPFRLDEFTRCAPRYFNYTEEILSTKTKKELQEEARLLACEDTTLPELERVFQGPAKTGIVGQPVHYLIRSDDDGVRKQMTELLVTALLSVERVHNRRLCFLHCDEDTESNSEYLDLAFRYCEGGALALDLKNISRMLNDGDQAQACAESVQSVCDCLRNHRNRVLTVLSLPRTGDKCLSLLRDKLGNIPVVELQEDMLFGERSSRFLRRVARENGITAPRSLMKQLDDPEKGWLPGDIRGTFDRWFTNYLRETVYPQYACIETATEEVAKEKPVGSAYSELESMIGLNSAKDVIRQALDYYKAQKLFVDRGLNTGAPSLHMVFTGNPGTAKTTVARLFARIMKENGVLSHGNLHEVGRGDLVGKYVGWTAQTVQRKFREAKGSVLFIDEAYSLLDGHENSFGDEAINTIVQEMENCRDETVVIFAGYPKPMEEFLDRNPGLRSRIAFQVHFEDYDEEELLSIAETLAKAKGLRFGDGVREKILPIIRENRSTPDFGNGRFARNLVEKAAMCQASRLVRGDVAHVTDRELKTLLPEDFVRSPAPTKPKTRVIGFSV